MKSTLAKKGLVILAATLAWGISHAGEPVMEVAGPLSIAQAEEATLKTSRYLKQMDSYSTMAEARKTEAESMIYPRAEVSTSLMAGNNPVFVFGSLLEQSDFGAERFQIDKLNDPDPVTNTRTNISVQVPVYDGGQRSVAVGQANLGVEGVKTQREKIEQGLRLALVKGYFGLLLAREQETVTAESIQSAEADLKRAKDMHDAGMIVQSDLLALEVQLAEFRQQAIEAKTGSEIAREGLNMLLGYKENSSPELTTPLKEKPFALPEASSVASTAIANRSELAQADVEIKKTEEGLRLAENQYMPRVDAFGNYGLSAETLGVDSTDWTVGVRVSLPLLDFGRSPRIDQARAAQSGAKAARDGKKEQIAFEAISAYKKFIAAKDRLTVAAGAVAQAAEALRITSDRYQVGLNNISDVLRAESAVLRAKMGEAAARYNIYVGYAEFLHATGTLRSVKAFE